MSTEHKGQLSDNTIKLLKEADRKLFEAFEFLEATACIASEEIAGGSLDEVSDETGNLIGTHPLVKAAWDLVASMEDKHSKLQDLLKVEEKRGANEPVDPFHERVDRDRFIVLEGPHGPFWSILPSGKTPWDRQFLGDGTKVYTVLWYGDSEEECKRQYRKSRGLPEDEITF